MRSCKDHHIFLTINGRDLQIKGTLNKVAGQDHHPRGHISTENIKIRSILILRQHFPFGYIYTHYQTSQGENSKNALRLVMELMRKGQQFLIQRPLSVRFTPSTYTL